MGTFSNTFSNNLVHKGSLLNYTDLLSMTIDDTEYLLSMTIDGTEYRIKMT